MTNSIRETGEGVEQGTPEYEAMTTLSTALVLQGEANAAQGLGLHVVALATLYAGIALYGKAVGVHLSPAWLRLAASEMERTFPLERSVN